MASSNEMLARIRWLIEDHDGKGELKSSDDYYLLVFTEIIPVLNGVPWLLKPGEKLSCCRAPGPWPSHNGSKNCESGSLASGGSRSHCTCDVCF